MSLSNMTANNLRTLVIVVALGLFVVAGLMFNMHVSAHAGHGNEEVGEFDLDAPRLVTPETAKHIGLKAQEVEMHALEDVLEVSGVVRPSPDRHRAVVSRVAGKLVAIHFQVGSQVKKGDVVAEIDSPELARNQYEVRKLEVEYQKLMLEARKKEGEVSRLGVEIVALREQESVAQRDFDRAKSLSGEGVAIREVDNKGAELARLRGELQSKGIDRDVANAESDGLKKQAEALRLSRGAMMAINNVDNESVEGEPGSVLRIRAEADGVVTAREALPGQWVQAGERLFSIADHSVVQVEGELPESLISRVQKRSSDKVRIRPVSNPDVVLQGVLKFIAPDLDPEKRTAHLLVDVDNPTGELRGQMWVSLAIVLSEHKDSLVVPKSAVVVNGPMHFVFLEVEADPSGAGGKFQKHDIDPGLSNDLFVEIKDGVFPGDRVVTQGAYSLTQLRPKAGSKPAVAANTGMEKKSGH